MPWPPGVGTTSTRLALLSSEGVDGIFWNWRVVIVFPNKNFQDFSMKHEVHEMCRILRQALRKRPWCPLLPSLYMWLLLGAWIEKGSRFSRIVVLPSLCAEYLSIQGTRHFMYRLLVSYPDHLFAKMGFKAIQISISSLGQPWPTPLCDCYLLPPCQFFRTGGEDHLAKGNITSLGKAGAAMFGAKAKTTTSGFHL